MRATTRFLSLLLVLGAVVACETESDSDSYTGCADYYARVPDLGQESRSFCLDQGSKGAGQCCVTGSQCLSGSCCGWDKTCGGVESCECAPSPE